MPFKKVAPNTYRSPSGKTWTARQVKAYEATGGFQRPPRTPAKPPRKPS